MDSDITQKIPLVPDIINFPKMETEILAMWKKHRVFETCLKMSINKPKFSFYDGPPFATGLPHYGHILAGTVKDVVTRYAHQQGFHVPRRFGWDCHGLPIEFEIDKKLGIKGPEDVLKMGIAAYNDECRNILNKYVNEWEMITDRIGRWIDFKDDYKTMYPWFMESVWWIFAQLYSKGLVYRGVKVMPFSTGCNTAISNFESGQNYKDVIDPTVTVTLPLLNDFYNANLLVWTTTPWTLPSNLCACVHPTEIYVWVRSTSCGTVYVVMEARLEVVFKDCKKYVILKKCLGWELEGLKYQPIFDYYEYMKEKGAFCVVINDYVSTDCGTGIVHQAPYFGEEDYAICLKNKIITKNQDPICPIDECGRLTEPVHDFVGQYVKDADKNIIAALKKNNRLFCQSQILHSYPFCWRSDTPLIKRAVPSWFVRVEFMKELLLKANSETHWVPDFVKEKRFANWLQEPRDWAVSRNRFWGTPIPIWMSLDGEEIVCVSSVKQLEELTNTKIIDLHRESIDHLEIPSLTPGNPPLRRIPDVFDCWFESGCMPYAQQHFPFQYEKEFHKIFPADFIAEGIDQTRGWFYTLLVISTALFGKAPFKNVIASGLVLAADGCKMSKRKKNYPDPIEIVNKYGADALRLYLISSPVVKAENLRFKESGVRDIVKDVLLPWYNAFRFLLQNIDVYVKETNSKKFYYSVDEIDRKNTMDSWILSYTQSLLEYIRKEMSVYHLYNVVPQLIKYIEYLTNWYIRMNRTRLKGEHDLEDTKQGLLTLFNVLFNIVKMMAPFAPFISDYMYQILKTFLKEPVDSVHYLMLPIPNQELIDCNIERSFSRMQKVIDLGRLLRDRNKIAFKMPLREVIIVHQDNDYLNDVVSLRQYILTELNVKNLSTTNEKTKYGIQLKAKPNFKVLGKKLKNELKDIVKIIINLTDSEVEQALRDGFIEINGFNINVDELNFVLYCEMTSSRYIFATNNDLLVIIDTETDGSMIDEGIAREIINRIQKERKNEHLVPTDEITVNIITEGNLYRVCKHYYDFIVKHIKAIFVLTHSSDITPNSVDWQKLIMLKGCKFHMSLKKVPPTIPLFSWVNISILEDVHPYYCNNSRHGTILLQDKNKYLTYQDFRVHVRSLFGISKPFNMFVNDQLVTPDTFDMINGQDVHVTHKLEKANLFSHFNNKPYCKFENDTVNNVTWLLENPLGVPSCNRPI